MILLPFALGALLLAGDSTGGPPTPGGRVYRGRRAELTVAAVREEADAIIDGRLDEPQWQRAAVMTSFSQYLPADQRAAEDSTEVRVFYSPSAIHFGIRAWEPHGVVRATLADRDRIDGEDHVQLLLDTYHDHRRAFVFAVNAFGVQADGMRVEAQGGSTPRYGLQNSDLTPDFIFESKGRLTADGYEVEVRIPFKSLRYGGGGEIAWGINVLRQIQHSGFQDSWAPALRGSATFLGQSGTLTGLRDLRRGLVLDLNPVVTDLHDGAPRAPTGAWRATNRAELGGNVRWGVTPSLTLNATLNPDFSQVEADAQQVPADARFPVFFAERRPFFTDGIELVDMPNRLIYTRQIAAPQAAARLSGKVAGTDVAVIGAVDDRRYSATARSSPVFTIARLRHDVGAQSWVGMAYTDRSEAGQANRVVDADARFLFNRLYQFNAQVVRSVSTADGAPTRQGALWETIVSRTGRLWGFRFAIKGVSPDFETRSGFVPRANYVEATAIQRVAYLGPRGAWLQNWTTRLETVRTTGYREFFRGDRPLEARTTAQSDWAVRGGWSGQLLPLYMVNAFDPAQYPGRAVWRPGTAAPTPWRPGPRVEIGGVFLQGNTPQWRRVRGTVAYWNGSDVDYLEAAAADRRDLTAGMDWRPTTQLRVNPTYTFNSFRRMRDGTVVSRAQIPRLKVEYQLTRAVFVRYVGQYDARWRDALRDPATDLPLLMRRSDGSWAPIAGRASNDIRQDLLFSYFPSPGTVVYAGYGQGLADGAELRFRDVVRRSESVFVKVSYLFRL